MLAKLITAVLLGMALSGCQTAALNPLGEEIPAGQSDCQPPEPPEAFAWLSLSKDNQTHELALYIKTLLEAFQKCQLEGQSLFRANGG